MGPSRQDRISGVLESLGQLSSWMHATKRWRIRDDLTLHQATALYHVVTGDSLTPGALASRMQASPAATTALIDQLEKRGFVRRVANRRDRRSTRIEARPEAVKEWPAVKRRIDESAAATFSQWSDDDLAAFTEYMQRLLLDAKPPEVP